MTNVEWVIKFLTDQKNKHRNISDELLERWINILKEDGRLQALDLAIVADDHAQITEIISDFQISTFLLGVTSASEQDSATYALYLKTVAKLKTPQVIFTMLKAGIPICLLANIFQINEQDIEYNSMLNMLPYTSIEDQKDMTDQIDTRQSAFSIYWNFFYKKNRCQNFRLIQNYFISRNNRLEDIADRIVIACSIVILATSMFFPYYSNKTLATELLQNRLIGLVLNFSILLSGEFSSMVDIIADQLRDNQVLAIKAQIVRIPLFFALQTMFDTILGGNLSKADKVAVAAACLILLSYSFVYSYFIIPLANFVEQRAKLKTFWNFNYDVARKELAAQPKPQKPIMYLYKIPPRYEKSGEFVLIPGRQLTIV